MICKCVTSDPAHFQRLGHHIAHWISEALPEQYPALCTEGRDYLLACINAAIISDLHKRHTPFVVHETLQSILDQEAPHDKA